MEASGKLVENLHLDIAELNKYIQDSKRNNVRVQLEEIKNVMTKQLNEEQRKLEKLKSEQSEKKETKPVSIETYITISKYGFENNKENVKVYLTDFTDFKSHPRDKITAVFQSKSFDIKIQDYKGKNYRICINNLNKEIKPDQSSFKQIQSGIVVTLVKEKDDFWDNLEKKPSLIKEKDDKLDKDKDPGASLMDMMKEMYNNGDDNMKKIIAESWSKAQTEKSSGKGFGKGPGGMDDI